jgi:hypothetical protein
LLKVPLATLAKVLGAVPVHRDHLVDQISCVVSASTLLRVEIADGRGAGVPWGRSIYATASREVKGIGPEVLFKENVDGIAAIGSVEISSHVIGASGWCRITYRPNNRIIQHRGSEVPGSVADSGAGLRIPRDQLARIDSGESALCISSSDLWGSPGLLHIIVWNGFKEGEIPSTGIFGRGVGDVPTPEVVLNAFLEEPGLW